MTHIIGRKAGVLSPPWNFAGYWNNQLDGTAPPFPRHPLPVPGHPLATPASSGTMRGRRPAAAGPAGAPMTVRPPALLATALLSALAACSSGSDGKDPVPAPVITSFVAADDALTTGGSTTLTAVFTGGTATVSPGVGSVTSGVAASTGALAADTTFTLTVTNADGLSVTATETVRVFPAATVTSFTAAKSPITAGTATTLTAVFSDGTATVDHGVGDVTSGTAASTGTLTADTTFTLTVTNPAGDSVTQQATVTVVSAPLITSFAPTADTILQGTGTDLVAIFTGGTGWISPDIGAVASGVGVATGDLDATSTWTLTVTNAAGDAVTADATVTVVPPPSITRFTSAAPFVLKGTPATLTAVFAHGTGDVDGGVGAVTSGVPVATPNLDAPTTFTLTVTGFGGATATRQVTVDVYDCADGVKNGDEVGVDCGGSCGTCPADCAAILAATPGAPSGVYGIDPDGDGGDGAIAAYCDMTTDGGGYTLCGSFGDNAKGDGLGYLSATWGTSTTPFFDGTTVTAHGSFCNGLTFSSLYGAHWSSPTAERFRTAPISTGGENPFGMVVGSYRYTNGGNAIALFTKDAMSRGVHAWGACAYDDNNFNQGTSLCITNGANWNMIVGNLNNYMYRGEGEWMCGYDFFCAGPDGAASILVFAR